MRDNILIFISACDILIGTAWITLIVRKQVWWVNNIKNDAVFGVNLILSLLILILGVIGLLSFLER